MVGKANPGSLRIQGHYNYEDRRTASIFGGWTFSTAEVVTASITPMAGVAFGRTTGVVPAVEVSLGTGMFDLYAEGEFLIDVNEKSSSLF